MLVLPPTRFNTNHVQFSGTGGDVRPGQHGQHIYTEYQNLGPNNGLNLRPQGGQRPTTRQPLIYIPVADPDGNRVPLVKVRGDPPLSATRLA